MARRSGNLLTGLIVLGGVFSIGVAFGRIVWKPKQIAANAPAEQPAAASG